MEIVARDNFERRIDLKKERRRSFEKLSINLLASKFPIEEFLRDSTYIYISVYIKIKRFLDGIFHVNTS